jgi:DNA-binding MarR family transcriptional regulator
MKVGVGAVPQSAFFQLPTSVRMVLIDVFEHPGGTIGQIVERTGFPQSHVSAAVARLRENGILITETDPEDRRRTIVVPSPEHLANIERAKGDMPPIDATLEALLVERFGPQGAARLAEVTDALDLLAALFLPPNRFEPVTRPTPAPCATGDSPC